MHLPHFLGQWYSIQISDFRTQRPINHHHFGTEWLDNINMLIELKELYKTIFLNAS